MASINQGGEPGSFPVYARKATGLVREVSLLDNVAFGLASVTPLASGLFASFFVLLVFPRTNFVVALIVATIGCLFVWTCFALLAATIPKLGGDYVYTTRILHPAVGFGLNLCVIVAQPITAGLVATWVATFGLSPVFTTIGVVTGSETFIDWGNYFTFDHEAVVFVTATIVVIILSILGALGTKILLRTMTIMVFIFGLAWLVELFLLIVTGHQSFVNTFEDFAGQGSYRKVIEAGEGSGLYPTGGEGYSARSTIGTIFQSLGIVIYAYFGIYLAAEFRRAGQRKRQLITCVGTGLLQGLSLIITAILFYNVVGQEFFISALNGNLETVGIDLNISLANFSFFAALVAGNEVIVTLLSLCFLLWIFPLINITMVIFQRGLFVYSFEGLLPRWVAGVNERTHAPIVAIVITAAIAIGGAAWAAYLAASFFTLLTLVIMLPLFGVFGAGVSAVIMSRRRPDLYTNSAADWHPGGVPVLVIAGAGTCLVAAVGIALPLYFHEEIGIAHPVWAGLAGPLTIAAGIVWWYGARAVRRRQGIDLDLLYKTIPPD